jgi:hypothetical protein
VAGVLTDDELTGLVAEATAHAGLARERVVREPRIGPDGRLVSPSAHSVALGGDALSAIHEDAAVLRFLRELTGRRLFPTRATYLYYPRDGFLGIHTDIATCSVSLLVALSTDVDDLVVHPELVGASGTALMKLAGDQTGTAPGVGVPFPCRGWIVLLGADLPHRRPRTARPSWVASLCYDALL